MIVEPEIEESVSAFSTWLIIIKKIIITIKKSHFNTIEQIVAEIWAIEPSLTLELSISFV